MSTQVGMTDSQARKLIELAEKSGCMAKVRTFRKDTNHTHSGRAFLISVVNKTEALIKPFTHRKEETVPLTTLRFWKSGCEFDITEAEQVVEEPTAAATQTTASTRFVIYSAKAEGVWAGSTRKWIKNVQSAIFYQGMAHAESTIKGFQKTFATDAILITDIDATSRLSVKNVVKPSLPIVQKPILTVTVPTVPQDTEDATMNDEYALNFDPIALAKAAEDYKKVVEEIKAAEALKQEALKRLEEVKKIIGDLVGTVQTKAKPAAAAATKRTSAKPGAVKTAVVTVLKSCSRLDLASLVARANPLTPESTRDSVKQAVYKLKRDGLIEQNENGFALTALGRTH